MKWETVERSGSNKFDLIGHSTIPKPEGLGSGSVAYEVDTKNSFIYYNNTWYVM